jgi:hypothetical protein
MPTEAEIAQARQQMEIAEHYKDVNAIVDLGRERYGSRSFDEASEVVGGALGPEVPAFMAAIREFDAPDAVVMHLADNEAQLRALAKMSTAQKIVEIARISDSPMSSDPEDIRLGGGRRRDWMDVAPRVSNAISRWMRMSGEEKSGISNAMAARRADAAIAGFKKVLARFEERLAALEAK